MPAVQVPDKVRGAEPDRCPFDPHNFDDTVVLVRVNDVELFGREEGRRLRSSAMPRLQPELGARKRLPKPADVSASLRLPWTLLVPLQFMGLG